jgi:hypothetical protein
MRHYFILVDDEYVFLGSWRPDDCGGLLAYCRRCGHEPVYLAW